MREASANNTTVSVASASTFTASPVGGVSTRSRACAPVKSPTPTKMIAGVIEVPSTRRETTPNPIRDSATTARAHCIVSL